MQSDFFGRSLMVLSNAWGQATQKLIEILPQAFVAVLILTCGILVAVLVRFLLLKFLSFFAADKLVAKTQLTRLLRDVGIQRTASEILGSLIFWLIVLFTLIFAAEALALTQVAQALTVVTHYVPKIIAAFLIVVFGMLLAKFLQTFVIQTIGRTEHQYERIAGKIVHTVVIVFVLIAALEQLEVELSLVTTNFMILAAVLISVTGLVLGIGARPLLENYLACQQLQMILKKGEHLHVAGVSGTITSFTGTMVIVRTHEGDALIPARLLLEQLSRRNAS